MSGRKTCVEFEELLHERLDGALDADSATEVERHVQECPACAALLRDLEGLAAGLGLLPTPDLDDTAWERAVTTATRSGARRRTPRWVAVPALVAAAVLCWALLHLQQRSARGTESPRRDAPSMVDDSPPVTTTLRQETPDVVDRPAPRAVVTARRPSAARHAPTPRRREGPRPSRKRPAERVQPVTSSDDGIAPPPPGPMPEVPEWLSTPGATQRLVYEAPPLPGPEVAEEIAQMRVVLLAAQAEGSPEALLLPPELLESLGGSMSLPSGAGSPSGERGRSG